MACGERPGRQTDRRVVAGADHGQEAQPAQQHLQRDHEGTAYMKNMIEDKRIKKLVRFCSIHGCFKPARLNSYCLKHNYKFKKYGDPLAPCGGKEPISKTHPTLVLELVDKQLGNLTKGSSKKVEWECDKGHRYFARVCNRAIHGTGCAVCNCANVLITGVNDLATKFPELAKEALFDPTKEFPATTKKLKWKCSKCSFVWIATGSKRTDTKHPSGCPACKKKAVLPGVNDLATLRPDLVEELFDKSLASRLMPMSSKSIVSWVCRSCSFIWKSRVSNRALGSKCPKCFNGGGYKPFVGNAWLYLLYRDGQQKVGITSKRSHRISTHKKNGWRLIDIKVVDGLDAQEIEKQVLFVLKELNVPTGAKAFRKSFDGYTESWQTVDFYAENLDVFYRKLYSEIWNKIFSLS